MTEHPQLKYGMAEFPTIRNDGISQHAERGARIKQQFWVKDFHSNLNNCRRKNDDIYDVSTARTTPLHRLYGMS